MSMVSRRKFLGLGAGVLAALGLGSSAHSRSFGSPFVEPEVRSSANGFLSTTFRASRGTTTINGDPVVSSIYEGMFPGPTLKIRPGDFVRIQLINDLDAETNLHMHGLHVSPQSPGDNVLLNILPGERFVYEYTLPTNHPGGTYFYHPHRHGFTANQTFKGMAGMIIIEGAIDQLPGIAGLPERALVLQRVSVVGGSVPDVRPNQLIPPRVTTVLVNGVQTPIMYIRPGETQRWRLLDATVSSFWSIQVEDHDLTLISRDGNTLARAVTQSAVSLAPAQRRDVLIRGGRPGVYRVTYQDTQSSFATPPPPATLAYLFVTGPPMRPQPLPTTLLPFLDLRTVPVDRQRLVTFETIGDPASPTFGGQGFVINGQEFDEHRIDQFANLGATEEWTVQNNDTDISHPFHIHINPYQVTRISGEPVVALSYEDTTPLPPGGSITFRTRFLDFTGTWVFHCHILGHEDGGMMSTIQVS
jgi:FtsP/CotA-like multicopper oxidase with cupredoxin domain